MYIFISACLCIVCAILLQNSDSTLFHVNMTQCPPGYVISNFTSRLKKCECEVANEGIINCENLDIQIKVKRIHGIS